MPPLLEDILDAFENALVAGLPGVLVERDRDIEADTFPSVNILQGGHEVLTENHGIDDVVMTITCELFETGSTAKIAGTALNTLYGNVIKAAMVDRTLGGLLTDMEEDSLDEPVVLRQEGQGPAKAVSLDFLVQYQRRPGDPDNLYP